MTSQSAQRVAEISHIAGTAPLPPRRLQELKRGNGKQSVSVQILGEQICSIERGIAQHFSQIWRQRLANPMVTIVHVAFPPPAPAATPENAPAGTAPAAPSTTTSATIPGSAPATTPRTQAIDPLEKNTVKFLIQWMQRGGADPVGPNALIYPQGNPAALGKLHQLAVSLKIDPLIARTNVPTASANRQGAARRPKACYKCGQQGHLSKTCEYCRYCRRTGHLIDGCERRQEAGAKRRAWRQEQADRKRRHLEYLERDRRRKERAERDYEKSVEEGFRKGQLGLGGDEGHMWI